MRQKAPRVRRHERWIAAQIGSRSSTIADGTNASFVPSHAHEHTAAEEDECLAAEHDGDRAADVRRTRRAGGRDAGRHRGEQADHDHERRRRWRRSAGRRTRAPRRTARVRDPTPGRGSASRPTVPLAISVTISACSMALATTTSATATMPTSAAISDAAREERTLIGRRGRWCRFARTTATRMPTPPAVAMAISSARISAGTSVVRGLRRITWNDAPRMMPSVIGRSGMRPGFGGGVQPLRERGRREASACPLRAGRRGTARAARSGGGGCDALGACHCWLSLIFHPAFHTRLLLGRGERQGR